MEYYPQPIVYYQSMKSEARVKNVSMKYRKTGDIYSGLSRLCADKVCEPRLSVEPLRFMSGKSFLFN